RSSRGSSITADLRSWLASLRASRDDELDACVEALLKYDDEHVGIACRRAIAELAGQSRKDALWKLCGLQPLLVRTLSREAMLDGRTLFADRESVEDVGARLEVRDAVGELHLLGAARATLAEDLAGRDLLVGRARVGGDHAAAEAELGEDALD